MAAVASRSTKFVVDAMLGSLSRKLRAFGFDSTYYKNGKDSGILSACRRQKRVLVTADRQLVALAAKRGLPCLLVAGETDRARLLSLMASAQKIGLKLKTGEPRCSLCNGKLAKVRAARIRMEVPESVAKGHRLFYRCSNCGQIYWKGGHWKQLRRLEALFRSKS